MEDEMIELHMAMEMPDGEGVTCMVLIPKSELELPFDEMSRRYLEMSAEDMWIAMKERFLVKQA